MPRILVHEQAHLWFYIYPFDCDLNGHLTNSKYLAFMDLGRVSFIQQVGLLNTLYQRRCFPVLQSIDMTFIKEIRPGSRLLLKTKLLGLDEKYIYLEQNFLVNDQLHAIARVRGVFIGPKGKLANDELLSLMQDKGNLPILPNSINVWKTYLADKKNETTS